MSLHPAVVQALVLAASSKKSTTSSTIFLLIVVIAAVLLFTGFRRASAQRRGLANPQNQNFEVGRQVLLRAGIYGRIRGFEGDDVLVETAPGTVIRVVRQAIGQVMPPPTSEPTGATTLGDEPALDAAAPYGTGEADIVADGDGAGPSEPTGADAPPAESPPVEPEAADIPTARPPVADAPTAEIVPPEEVAESPARGQAGGPPAS